MCEESLNQNSTPRKNVLAGEVLNPDEQKAQRLRKGLPGTGKTALIRYVLAINRIKFI
ncbi:hypothetical protein [Coxiella endosymbiont of Ornithodoros amblus]|uniref:hypothetical protein n=1 Tax=Coxiella endosymbiont of Ornithodoros amblus TaxID=1656166 RepID=UPI00244D9A22|nr:hypothetical protein [Coxiella endosymbiont of Ornithodoros amblus]